MRCALRRLAVGVVVLAAAVVGAARVWAAPAEILFSSAPAQVERFDYVEITATVKSPDVRNPFTDASLTGTLETADGGQQWRIEGFADSDDGSVFRIRFMPVMAGEYKYTVTYQEGEFRKTASGMFRAVEAHRRGVGHCDGGRVPDRGRDGAAGNKHLAGYGRRLDECSWRRHDDDVPGVRAHGGFLYRV